MLDIIQIKFMSDAWEFNDERKKTEWHLPPYSHRGR